MLSIFGHADHVHVRILILRNRGDEYHADDHDGGDANLIRGMGSFPRMERQVHL